MLKNMIEPVSGPSTRARLRPRLALWPVVVLVLVALFFTASLFAVDAQASGDAPGGAANAAIGEAATNGVASSDQSGSSTGEQSPSVPETAPPTTKQAPPVVEQSAGDESVSTVEQTLPASEQSPVATEQPAVPTEAPPPAAAEPAPPAAEATAPVAPPPAEQLPPVAVEVPPTVEQHQSEASEPSSVEELSPVVDKKTTEQTAGDVAAEADSEAIQGSGEGSQAPADPSVSTHKDAADEVDLGASPAVTPPAAPAVLPEISMPSVQDQPSLAFPPPPTLVHGAGQASCELAAFGASIAGRDADGLLDIAAVTPVSTHPLATVEASPTVITTGGSAGDDDGSPVEHPSSPSPGPGSGGAGCGSAAGGGSGSASPAPFTLGGVLLQAAPRAMRRLLLAQQSWRTSFLVLIPERPD
jgi:hypothetical protein